MSPSESDLRAALQHGDDDAGLRVSANAIIAQGQAVRARRVRILSGTAAAVVVAGGAIGLASLQGTSNSGSGGGAASDLAGGGRVKGAELHDRVAPQPAGVPAAPTAAPSTAASTARAAGGGDYGAASTICPATAPHLVVPGQPGRFGSTEPLFAKPVVALVVCSYGSPDVTSTSSPTRLELTGRAASQVINSLESSRQTPAPTPCDPGPTSTSRLLAFVGLTANGKALDPVTATVPDPACNVQVTNGTAVRYDWTPPAALVARLRGLTPPKVPPRTVPAEPVGSEHGSPIHS